MPDKAIVGTNHVILRNRNYYGNGLMHSARILHDVRFLIAAMATSIIGYTAIAPFICGWGS